MAARKNIVKCTILDESAACGIYEQRTMRQSPERARINQPVCFMYKPNTKHEHVGFRQRFVAFVRTKTLVECKCSSFWRNRIPRNSNKPNVHRTKAGC